MNKQIKFMAWDKERKKMAGVAAIEWNPDCSIKRVLCVFQVEVGGGLLDVDEEWRDASVLELLQFTGLNDTNGKEIYEGDIFGAIPELRCVVKQRADGAYILEFIDARIPSMSILDPKVSKSPIIGDIYQNPELLQ